MNCFSQGRLVSRVSIVGQSCKHAASTWLTLATQTAALLFGKTGTAWPKVSCSTELFSSRVFQGRRSYLPGAQQRPLLKPGLFCWMCRVWAPQACWVNPHFPWVYSLQRWLFKVREMLFKTLLRILHSLPLVTQPYDSTSSGSLSCLHSHHFLLLCSLDFSKTGVLPVSQNHRHIPTSGHLFPLPRMPFPQMCTRFPSLATPSGV